MTVYLSVCLLAGLWSDLEKRERRYSSRLKTSEDGSCSNLDAIKF